jgi:N-methylhydantoinase B
LSVASRAEEPFDPILVEVLRHELEAIVEEMEITVRKTARSPLARVGDNGVALCDGEGKAIGVGTPSLIHATFYHVLHSLVADHGDTMVPGDVFIVNDPYAGASHIPDVLVYTPIFWRDRRVAFSVCYSHHTDMGGRFPGSMTGHARDAYEEGVRIPPVRYASAGVRNDDLLDVLAANVRAPADWLGDLEAKVAGGWRAGEQLGAVLDEYGLDPFRQCCRHQNQRSERLVRAAIAKIPSAPLHASVELLDDGIEPVEPSLQISVTLRRERDELIVDFDGTSPQAAGAVNMPYGNLLGSVFLNIHRLLCTEALLNEGFMAPIRVRAPHGSLVNPRFPAAVGGRAPTLSSIDEVMHLALSPAFPDQIPVPRELYDGLHFTHVRADGSVGAVLDLCCPGWGARPDQDGIDGAGSSSLVMLPAEFLEREFPIVVEGCGLLPDTAGPGRFRGSMGVYRAYRFLSPGHVMVRSNRVVGPDGMQGGHRGSPARTVLTTPAGTRELPPLTYCHLDVQAGDTLVHELIGTGGHGSPLERAPHAVLRDVREERLTVEAAAAQYAVVIDPGTLTIDDAATDELRAAR